MTFQVPFGFRSIPVLSPEVPTIPNVRQAESGKFRVPKSHRESYPGLCFEKIQPFLRLRVTQNPLDWLASFASRFCLSRLEKDRCPGVIQPFKAKKGKSMKITHTAFCSANASVNAIPNSVHLEALPYGFALASVLIFLGGRGGPTDGKLTLD